MTALPGVSAKTSFDAMTDDPKLAPAELAALVDNVNTIRLYLLGLLGSAGDAATARAALGAVIGTDVLAPTGDGSGLTGIAAGATTAEKANIALNSFRIAVNGGLSVQNMIDGVVDEFTDQTGVDTVTSTNETYDATGDYYHNPGVDTRITGGIPTAPFGGTAANINDNTPATVCTSTTLNASNLTGVAVSGRILFQLDLGSIKVVTKIEAVGYRRTSGSGDAMTLYYSTDAVTWTQAGAALTSATTVAQSESRTGLFSARYVAFVTTAVNWIGGGELEIQDLNAYELSAAPNMTLQSNTHTALVQPSSVFAVLWHEPVDVVTLNADLTAEASRDGGTTWSAATLALSANLVGNEQILTGTADVSAQPAGTSIKWRIKTLNNKEQRLRGVSEQWS